MVSFFHYALIGISVATSSVQALTCVDNENGRPLVSVEFGKNRYGAEIQTLTALENISIEQFGEIHKGAVFESHLPPETLRMDECTDGAGLGVSGLEQSSPRLIFGCYIDSGPPRHVLVADLDCR